MSRPPRRGRGAPRRGGPRRPGRRLGGRAPRSDKHRRPTPRGTGRRAPPKPKPKPKPEPPPRPKAFEIRRGRSEESDDELIDVERPLANVALPASITQEAEASSLRRRFGTEHVPDLSQRDDRVMLHRSVGTEGPDRYIRRRIVYGLLALLIGGGAAAWYLLISPSGPQLLGPNLLGDR